jgi:hypothetical protein
MTAPSGFGPTIFLDACRGLAGSRSTASSRLSCNCDLAGDLVLEGKQVARVTGETLCPKVGVGLGSAFWGGQIGLPPKLFHQRSRRAARCLEVADTAGC